MNVVTKSLLFEQLFQIATRNHKPPPPWRKMDNEESRKDEIDALSAIYAEDWIVEDRQCSRFSLSLNSDIDTIKYRTLRLEFKLPPNYPAEEKPIFVVSAPWMSRDDKACLLSELNDLCEQNPGQSVLYILIEKASQTLNEIVEKDSPNLDATDNNSQQDASDSTHCQETDASSSIPDWNIQIYHSDPLVDRKSTFQAHLAAVHSAQEAEYVLAKLKENRKICSASHNIWAFRILSKHDSSVINQNCDDDGETHAGSRLMHLLQIVDAKNVMVVVSRWYGGIKLGSDRFKHINNVARALLVSHNYINKWLGFVYLCM